MKNLLWLRKDVIIAAHEEMLAAHGGSEGLRDPGLLDSALARPLNLNSYGNPSIFELAACYAFGLIKNHPFIDGNKRAAFLASVLFLEVNGYAFEASEADAVIQTLLLAESKISEADFAEWLRANCSKA